MPEPRKPAYWASRAAMVLGAGLVAVRVLLPRPATPEAAGPPQPGDDTSGEVGRGYPARPASAQAHAAGHETGDLSGRTLARLVAGLGSAVAVMVCLMLGLHAWLVRSDRAAQPPFTAEQTARIVPPLPHLQADPVAELAALRAREDSRLSNYGWTSSDHARGRIPIERAKVLILGHPLDTAP